MLVYIEEVKRFFLDAMARGWVAGAPKITIPLLPGYKGVEHTDGGFRLLDLYCVTPSSTKSAGTTTIWYNGIPIWIMDYGGQYSEDGILVLKQALLIAYAEKRFLGGRGVEYHREGDFLYTNMVTKNHFTDFEGTEELFRSERSGSDQKVGYHRYWGMSLVDMI